MNVMKEVVRLDRLGSSARDNTRLAHADRAAL